MELIGAVIGVDVILLFATVVLWRRAERSAPFPNPLPTDVLLPIVTSLLVTIGILLFLTPFAYYLSYPADLRSSKGWRATLDCLNFTLPCLAGVVAGFALVSRPGQDADFRTDPNARYYLGSAIVLVLGYISYLLRHYRPVVVYSVGIGAIYAAGAGLAVTLFFRYFPAKADSKTSAPGSSDPSRIPEISAEKSSEDKPPEPTEQPLADPIESAMTNDDTSNGPDVRGAANSVSGHINVNRRSEDSWRGLAYASMWILGSLLIVQITAALIYAATNGDLAVLRAYKDAE